MFLGTNGSEEPFSGHEHASMHGRQKHRTPEENTFHVGQVGKSTEFEKAL